MTTGSKIIGAFNVGEYHLSKTWNGADGKYTGGKLNQHNYTLNMTEMRRTKGISSYISGGGGSVSAWTNADSVYLQNSLLTTVKGHSFNLGVALAEGGQTVALVKSSLYSIGTAIRALKHADFAAAARSLGVKPRTSRLSTKDIAGRWLELQYGWLPLLSDVYESSKAFSRIADGPRTEVYKVYRRRIKSQSTFESFRFINSTMRSNGSITAIMRENLTRPRSLGLENPASVIWEIIPYSFVIDWFIPIGTYLENLNQIPLLQGQFMTSRTDVRSTLWTAKKPPAGLISEQGATSQYTTVAYSRTVTSGLPVVRPSFKSLDSSLSPKHIWNAIALARQRIR